MNTLENTCDLSAINSNEHYGKLNSRFDDRAAELRSLGFVYNRLPVYDLAFFTKTRFGKNYTISAGLVLCADELVWSDYIERARRFCEAA